MIPPPMMTTRACVFIEIGLSPQGHPYATLGCESRAEDPERAIDVIQFDPFHSPWAPADSRSSLSVSAEHETAPATIAAATQAGDLRSAVNAYERALLEDALARSRFNQRATATALGLSYDQLRHALKRHKLMEAVAD